MNIKQHLYMKLAEECNELAQAALKSAQFGLESRNTETGRKNSVNMNLEFNDILTVIELINNLEDGMCFFHKIDSLMKNKVIKMKFYALESKENGMLDATIEEMEEAFKYEVL